jgi:hypothetical protein
MDKIKDSFFKLMKNDKAAFLLTFSRIGIAFLFFLGLVLPLATDPGIINDRVSLSQLPGGAIFIIVILATMFLNFYFVLIDNKKNARLMLLIQLIAAIFIFLYGLLFKTVGFDFAKTGFGFILVILMTMVMTFVFIKEKIVYEFIKKTFVKDKATESPAPEVIAEKKE